MSRVRMFFVFVFQRWVPVTRFGMLICWGKGSSVFSYHAFPSGSHLCCLFNGHLLRAILRDSSVRQRNDLPLRDAHTRWQTKGHPYRNAVTSKIIHAPHTREPLCLKSAYGQTPWSSLPSVAAKKRLWPCRRPGRSCHVSVIIPLFPTY